MYAKNVYVFNEPNVFHRYTQYAQLSGIWTLAQPIQHNVNKHLLTPDIQNTGQQDYKIV